MPTGLGGEKLWLCPTLEGENLDLSGNSNHGTYYGGMGTVVSKYRGTKAFLFDGSNTQRIECDADVIGSEPVFSVSCWAYVNQHDASYGEGFVSQFGAGTNSSTCKFTLSTVAPSSSITPAGYIRPSTSNIAAISSKSIEAQTWHHLCFIADGSKTFIYLDGFLRGTNTYTGTVRTVTNPLVIGTYNQLINQNHYLNGMVDDVRAYSRVLTPTEITHLASKRGVLGSPHSPITLKSRITKLVSDRDDSIKPNLLSINKPKRSEPSYKSGYAKSASESASPHLWDGLVGAWMPSLGVTGETLRDVSGNRNHGTLTNMDAASDWVVSKSKQSIEISGGNYEHINISDSLTNSNMPAIGSSDHTIISNVYNLDIAEEDIVGSNGIGAGNILLMIVASRVRCHVWLSSGVSVVDSSQTVGTGKWMQVVQRAKFGQTLDVYVNGRKSNSTALPNLPFDKGAGLLLGARYAGYRGTFLGSISDTLTYNRALSPQEIQELYVDSLAPFRQKSIRIFGGVGIPTDTSKIITVKRNKSNVEPSYKSGYAQSAGESAHPNLWDGLVGAWMPSMGVTGKTLRDVSGNENHGTLTNMDPATDWVTTSKGKALYFDNNVHKVDYNTNFEPAFDGSYTFSCLVNFFFADDRDVLFGNYNAGSSWLNFERHTSNRLRHVVRFTSSSFVDDYTSNNAVSYGWNYINFTRQRLSSTQSKLIYHVNGKEVRNATVAYEDRTITNPDFYLGGDNRNLFTNLNGQIAWASIYNRALTPDEIQTLYVDSLAPFRKKQQVAFNAYPLTLLQKIRSAAKPTTPVSVRVKHNEEPSYKAGYAKSADESASPHLWNGLVGAWMPSMGVTGDTLRDVSGNGNHGTLTNMDAATDWVATSKGLALDFDGDNDYIELGSIAANNPLTLDGNRGGTIVCNALTRSGDPFQRLFDKSTAGTAINGYNLVLDNTYGLHGSINGRWAYTGKTYNYNQSYQFAWSFIGDDWKYYQDAEILPHTIFTGPLWSDVPQVTTNARIGSWNHSTGRELKGNVSSLLIYNRALSPQEIQELYVDSLAPFRRKKSPIGYQPNKELRGLFKV